MRFAFGSVEKPLGSNFGGVVMSVILSRSGGRPGLASAAWKRGFQYPVVRWYLVCYATANSVSGALLALE
jgi:hypothetical protein